jgi:hypothetical protein
MSSFKRVQEWNNKINTDYTNNTLKKFKIDDLDFEELEFLKSTLNLINNTKIFVKLPFDIQSDIDNEFFTYRVFYILRQIIKRDGLFISYSNRGKNNLRIERLKRSP